MAELLGINDGVDGKRSVEIKIIAPLYALHSVVHLVGVGSLEMFDRLQDTDGSTKTEIGTVHHFLVAGERDHAPAYLHVVGAEFRKLLGEHFFKSLESFCDEFELWFHL